MAVTPPFPGVLVYSDLQYTPKWPDIHFIAVAFLAEHFRSYVVRCSTQGLLPLTIKLNLCGKAKIPCFKRKRGDITVKRQTCVQKFILEEKLLTQEPGCASSFSTKTSSLRLLIYPVDIYSPCHHAELSKLPILTSMSSLRKMLPSFRSLWITLLLCRYWTPLSSWVM